MTPSEAKAFARTRLLAHAEEMDKRRMDLLALSHLEQAQRTFKLAAFALDRG